MAKEVSFYWFDAESGFEHKITGSVAKMPEPGEDLSLYVLEFGKKRLINFGKIKEIIGGELSGVILTAEGVYDFLVTAEVGKWETELVDKVKKAMQRVTEPGN
jgi:hypothetical protein